MKSACACLGWQMRNACYCVFVSIAIVETADKNCNVWKQWLLHCMYGVNVHVCRFLYTFCFFSIISRSANFHLTQGYALYDLRWHYWLLYGVNFISMYYAVVGDGYRVAFVHEFFNDLMCRHYIFEKFLLLAYSVRKNIFTEFYQAVIQIAVWK